jgi:acid phosphatase
MAANREWRISPVLPMGARITLERLSCPSKLDESYVRINVNDRIVPLPFCKSGPGDSCPLNGFVEFVGQRKQEVGDFAERCGLKGDAGRISFLHQN